MVRTFGQVLRDFRLRAGLTITELASAIGAGRKSITLWEQDRRVPRDRARLQDLAEVLRLTTSEADELAALARQQGAAMDADEPAPQPDLLPQAHAPDLAALHQLRVPVGDFVGRSAEIAALQAALLQTTDTGSFATITGIQGMGGIGKTELAYKVAQHVRHDFPDAQIVLNLRGASPTPLPPEQALQTVIRAFIPEAKLPDDLHALEALYRSQLDTRRVLIFADDAHSVAQVEPLLPPAGSALLVTSRTRFTLPAMTTINLEQLSAVEALQLLRTICDRLTKDEAAALARACGYLPLALRISGSLLHTTPALVVPDYLAQLADQRQRLNYLRDPDNPQRDVVASLSLSYAQLDATAQQVFRQVGVLVADFDLPLAHVVVEEDTAIHVESILNVLLRRNLVMYDVARSRWRLHDLVRDLARSYLAAKEEKATMWRYARAVVQVTQVIQKQYLSGGDNILAALARFDSEHPHIVAARRWALTHAETPAGDILLRDDALASCHLEELRPDNPQERIHQLESALAATRRLNDQHSEGVALINLGTAYRALGKVRQAIVYYEQWLTLARAIGDQHGQGQALNGLSLAYNILGDTLRAITYGEQHLALTHATRDQRGEGEAFRDLGLAHMSLGEPRQAIAYYEQAFTIADLIGDQRLKAIVLNNIGVPYRLLGDLAQALTAFESASAIACTLGDHRLESTTVCNVGNVYRDMGETERAITYYKRALNIAHRTGDRHIEGQIRTMLGWGYLAYEDLVRARESSMAARVITQEVGDQNTEGLALMCLGRVCAAEGAIAEAHNAFEEARAISQAIGDRGNEAECNWLIGLALVQHGKREEALPLLRAALAYEQEIGHAKSAEHAALLARLEAGELLPPESRLPTHQRAIGDNQIASTEDAIQPRD